MYGPGAGKERRQAVEKIVCAEFGNGRRIKAKVATKRQTHIRSHTQATGRKGGEWRTEEKDGSGKMTGENCRKSNYMNGAKATFGL